MYKNEDECKIRCPYFTRQSQYGITCEGIINDSDTVSKFASEEKKQMFMEKECFNYPNNCPVCMELEKKYKEKVG